MSGPRLTGLTVADPPQAWERLGFDLEDGGVDLGGVRVGLGAPGSGITAWELAGLPATEDIDGLPTTVGDTMHAQRTHANGATQLDHVVVVTPDFDRTARAFDGAGLALKRIRDAGGFRQGFRRLGPCILELVEARDAPGAPAKFWGLVVVVEDLDALHERLAPHLGAPKPAVQPGRRIATLRGSACLTPKLAFMTPEAERTAGARRTTPDAR